MGTFGTHIVAELSLCEHIFEFDDTTALEEMMLGIITEVGLHHVGHFTHKFDPHGISCTIILQESHLATHIFPEVGYAALDVYTCGEQNEPLTEEAVRLFAEKMGAKAIHSYNINRGLPMENNPGVYTLSAMIQ